MDTIKFENRNTRVVAHRGVSGLERENTASAFVAAGNRTYYGVETDIYRTADGPFVINHDGNLKRISGDDINVETATWDTLKNVILYDMDGTKNRFDLRLARLENYLSICKHYGKHCVLELKSAFTDEETARFVDICRAYDYLDHITFISFNYDDLLKVKALLPDQPCQYLTGDNSDEMIEKLKSSGMGFDIIHTALTEERIAAMHRAGLEVNCWTVDDPARAEELAAWGVDYITSNILEGKNHN